MSAIIYIIIIIALVNGMAYNVNCERALELRKRRK